eukprot:CAMPEP_0204219104 /NCGR_PEP_ID=MMETSP0361-20130328/80073_1 /ASSEMBLY_ACC=CAM_ASM_000343 /TAXON_ID=268821 /ORGANISM="Scrippsiella Hangoei, Strain SHTV-5" /LENGTH=170 /DNA_ID=CAMNT_0051184345 /DNA_START=176 /DNA_END=688 /DNA_ORIENTATION=-
MKEKEDRASSARTVVNGNCNTSTSSQLKNWSSSSQLKNRFLLLSSLPTNGVRPSSADKTRSTLPPSSIVVDLPTSPKRQCNGGLTELFESEPRIPGGDCVDNSESCRICAWFAMLGLADFASDWDRGRRLARVGRTPTNVILSREAFDNKCATKRYKLLTTKLTGPTLIL